MVSRAWRLPLYCNPPAVLERGRREGRGKDAGSRSRQWDRGLLFCTEVWRPLFPFQLDKRRMIAVPSWAVTWRWTRFGFGSQSVLLGKWGEESSQDRIPRNTSVILRVVITKLSRSILMVSVIPFFITASVFSVWEWEYCCLKCVFSLVHCWSLHLL